MISRTKVNKPKTGRKAQCLISVQMLSFSVASFILSVQVLSEFRVHRTLSVAPPHEEASPFGQWLRAHPDTAGARLVSLMKQYMHVTLTSEGDRIQACQEKNYPVCFAGTANLERSEWSAQMPLTNVSVFQVRRYAHNNHTIANLGTEPVCLPLLLAGAAVQDAGVAVELGPYLGLSSRCLGLGINTTRREGRFHVFDSFEGKKNYRAITKSTPWSKMENPFFTEESNSFLWLWEKAVLDVYPTVKVHVGQINSKVVRPRTWNKQNISLLVIDSIKSWNSWKEQLGGLGRTLLNEGSIFVAMDFMFTDQPNFVYACLRDYLQPIYTSWCRGEHWIFVVIKAIPHDKVSKCMQNMLYDKSVPDQLVLDRIRDQIKTDLIFLRNLGHAVVPHDYLDEQSRCTQDSLLRWKLGSTSESERFWRRFRRG